MRCERLGVSRSILSFSYFNKEHSIYDFFLSDWESSGDEGYKNIRETERKMDGETEGRRRNTGRLSSGNVNENFAKLKRISLSFFAICLVLVGPPFSLCISAHHLPSASNLMVLPPHCFL